jgi:hypothetical protein
MINVCVLKDGVEAGDIVEALYKGYVSLYIIADLDATSLKTSFESSIQAPFSHLASVTL